MALIIPHSRSQVSPSSMQAHGKVFMENFSRQDCVCIDRWYLPTPPMISGRSFVVIASTHERALEIVPLEILRLYAVDVPADPGTLEH